MVSRCLPFVSFASTFAAAAIATWAVSTPVGDWRLSGPFGGTATAVALDPQQPDSLLAGAMNSLLFQSGDGGATWSLIDFPQHPLSTVTSILVDPSDSKHYFVGITAADGGGLFESQDSGKSWSAVKDISDFGVRALAAAPSNHSRFIAGTLHGVMLSDDCGKTWKRISDAQNQEMEGITSIAIDPSDANIIYAGTAHLPWKTTDGGKTWESIHTGMIDDSDVFSVYVDPTSPNNILASACSGIYSSGDRGELWHKLLGIPNTSRRTHVVREDPQSSSTIYAGTTTGLFKSTDSGKAWRTLTNIPVNAMAFNRAPPYSMYLALEYEGIGKSNDGGSAIELVDKGFVDRRITGVTVSGNKLLAFESQEGESSGLFVSSNRGETWTQLRTTRGLSGVHLRSVTGFAAQGEVLLAASHREMYKSIDGGGLWKPLPIRRIFPAPEPPKPKAPTKSGTASARTRTTTRRTAKPVAPKPIIKEIAVSDIGGLYTVKSDEKQLVFAATDLGLLRSDDFGEHWTLTEVPGSVAAMAVYGAESGGALILKASGGLYVSKDFGEHWNQITFPLPVSDVNDVAIESGDASALLAATRVGLYSSSDGGSSWSREGDKGLPASTVATVLYSPARHEAFAVEYGNLYARKDGAGSWSAVPSSLPSLKIRQLWSPDNNSERFYGITANLGVLFRD